MSSFEAIQPQPKKRGRPAKSAKDAESDAESDGSDNDGKHPCFPLARVKKVMRLDPLTNRTMLSQDAPLVMAKVAELFTKDITDKAWAQTKAAGRRTLQRADISAAALSNEKFDFLVDLLPYEDLAPHAVKVVAAAPAAGPTAQLASGSSSSSSSSAAAAAAGDGGSSRSS